MDVIVVGAGPIGCYLAYLLAKKGYGVRIYEEHKEVGRPLQCSGVVSENGLRSLNLYKKGFILSKVSEFRLHSFKTCLRLKLRKTKICILDRVRFDKYLARLAENKNACIELGKRVRIVRKNGRFFAKVGDKIERSKVIVVADGNTSDYARKIFGNKYEKIIAIQWDFPEVQRHIDVFFNKSLSKNFYAWVIPKGNCIGVGLGDSIENFSFKNFEKFLKNLKVEKKVINRISGKISIGYARKTCIDNLLAVGEAALQVKPFTGGGIIYGLNCAEIASFAISKYLENSNPLRLYEILWKGRYKKEIIAGLFLRKLYKVVGNPQIDLALKLLKYRKAVIEGYFDYESYFSLFLSFLTRG